MHYKMNLDFFFAYIKKKQLYKFIELKYVYMDNKMVQIHVLFNKLKFFFIFKIRRSIDVQSHAFGLVTPRI
jgi:hypothetical protein